jgi:DNA polymerase-3 subunit epsilon
MEYAVLDIESTGGKYNEEGIMEIAIFRFNGVEITDTFSALINPERPIQAFVSQLTGIKEPMLRAAPKFYEVARRIIEITEDTVLVAHNASFDYRILRTEFSRLGFDYKRPTLCTVALSQKLLPEAESHSLGKLTRSLGIPVSDRHRAYGDALATQKLLKILLLKEGSASVIQSLMRSEETGELSDNQLKLVSALPSATGIYSLYDKQGNLLFVGASANIRQSVTQHFVGRDKFSRSLQKYTKKVQHEISGTLLLAELQARSEQKSGRPKYIRKKDKSASRVRALHRVMDQDGYEGFLQGDRDHWEESEFLFTDQKEMEKFLKDSCQELRLCTLKCGLSASQTDCPIHLDEGHDPDPGMQEEPETYNQRYQKLLSRFSLKNKTVLLQDSGRVTGEKGFVFIRNGKIAGMGYTDLNYQLNSLERIERIMRPLPHNLHTRLMVDTYLREKSSIKTLYFS